MTAALRGLLVAGLLFLTSVFSVTSVHAQISGTVFRDFNANGAFTTAPSSTTEVGLAGVEVRVFNAAGANVTNGTVQTTNAAGAYSVTPTGSGPFRVEFTLPTSSSLTGYASGPVGTGSATSVQFVASSPATVNFGVNHPSDYCQTATVPRMVIPCYENGSGVGNTFPIIVSFAYSNSATTPGPTEDFETDDLGAVWGVAYQRRSKQVFTSAFLKRHAGLGPRGMDGVYRLDYSGATPTLGGSFELQGVTPANGGAAINLGTVNRTNVTTGISAGAAGDNQLPANRATANVDLDAFAKVGKTGYGGIELTEDENALWLVNLNQRALIRVNATNPLSLSGTLPTALVNQYPIASIAGVPACTNGTLRPFALKFYRGLGYLGCVCDAAQSTTVRQPAQLIGYVLSFDPASPTSFSTVLTIPLDYNREPAYKNGNSIVPGAWQRWTDTWNTDINTGIFDFTSAPQPILADIEFTEDGSMNLGFIDRFSHQSGFRNYPAISASRDLRSGVAAGDLIKATRTTAGAYVLEGGEADPGAPTTNTGYPGFLSTDGVNDTGEFYWGDYFVNFGNTVGEGHYETATGGLAQYFGKNEVTSTVFDPTSFFAQGIRWFNGQSGAANRSYLIVQSGNAPELFGKGSDLGDIELLCDAAPIQIGNRVFRDNNDNGVQDAGEPGIAGVTVTLRGPGLAASGVSVTTNAQGEYYFSNNAGTAATGFAYGLTGFTSGGSYTLTFPTSVSTSTISTKPNAATGTNAENIDTDASATGVISFTLGQAGENNHSFDVGFRTPACSLTLTSTVSGCYNTTAGSRATVSVEVAWVDVPVSSTVNDASDAITVTFAGQTRTINPGSYTSSGGNGDIVSPQVVAFEVSANASTQTAQVFIGATYAASTCRTQQTGLVLPAACPPTVCAAGQTGGTIFNDYNANGSRESGETAGQPGITVRAFDCTGNLVATTITDASGAYSFTGLTPASYPIRVEFGTLPAALGNGTPNGTQGNTTVQFVNAADCTVDLGVSNPNDYCQTTPKVVIPCYVTGDPLVSGTATAGTDDALLGFNYGRSGGVSSGTVVVTDNDHYAVASQVGSLWSVAYNKFTRRLYTSATLKRHVGLGPLGLGGIYVTDMATGTTTNYVNVTAAPLSINVGQSQVPTNAARGLSSNKNAPSADSLAFSLIGKVGIGGMDVSEDGQFLFFTNLFDKKIYKLNISAATPTLVGSYTIPDPGCVNGIFRPYALKVRRNTVYVGAVCDGTLTATKANMRAYVYAFDQNSSTFATTPIFDFPLTYPKGKVDNGAPNNTGWYPWTDRFSDLIIGTSTNVIHPQPMLVDLDFDVDGSMVLGLGDRTGLQGGNNNYRPNGTGSFSAYAGGDILRAASFNGVFVLENNAKVGPLTGWGVNNNEGPGFGEFYHDGWSDFLFGGDFPVHAENTMGGLAIRPGSGQTVSAEMDPVFARFGGSTFTGGVRYLSNTTGDFAQDATSGLVIYRGFLSTGVLGKATGLGDIEVACDVPTYLQIGNRVFRDNNLNGIQDACEPPIPGAVVTLFNATRTTALASVTTNAAGEYYFSSTTITAGTSTSSTATTALTPNTSYALVITSLGSSTVAAGLSLTGVTPLTPGESTTANSGTTTTNNDATVLNGQPTIRMTTGPAGSVNHTYDFGLLPCIPPSVTATASSNAVCVGQRVTLNTQVGAGGSFTVTAPTGVTLSSATASTITTGTLPTGINTFTITAGNAPLCFTTTTVSVTVSNAPVITLTASPSAICAGQTVNLSVAGVPLGGVVTFGTQGPLGTIVNPVSSGTFSPTATTTFVASVAVPGVGGLLGSVLTSCPVSVTVNQPPVIPPLGLSACVGTALNLSALTGTGGSLSALAGLTNVFRPGSVSTGAALTGPVAVTADVNTFNVISTNPLGCSAAAAPVSVTGIATPALPATLSLSACVGTALNLSTLTGTGASLSALAGLTNVFRPGSTTTGAALTVPVAITAGVNTFNVISTNVAGCSAVASISVTSVAGPTLPALSLSACAGTAVNLLALTGTGGSLSALTGLTNVFRPGSTTTGAGLTAPVSVSAGANLFNVTSTNPAGCTTNASVSVTGLATPSLTPVSTSLCVGLPLNLTGVLGTGNTLTGLTNTLLTGGVVTALPANLTVGAGVNTFNVVSTNANGCTAVTGVTVTGLATPTLTPVSVSLCVGLPLSLTSVLDGGTGNTLTGLTNTLLGGGTLPTSVSAGVTVFNVVSTNASGCTAVTPVTITGLTTPTLTPVSASLCVGLPLNLTGVLGTSNVLTGLTNTLLGGGTLPTSVSAGVTVFNVVSTNASGCTAVTPITVTGLTTPALTPVSASLCVGLPLNLTGILGTGNTLTGLTSTLLGGGTLPTSVSAGVTVFNVVSTNASGCTAVTPITVTGLATPTLNPVSVSLCVGLPLSLTSVLDTGAGNTLTGLTNTLLGGGILPTSVSAGVNVFNVVSTNASGCTAVTPVTVTGLATPTLTPVSASLCVGLPLNLTGVLGTGNTLTGLTNTLLGGGTLPTSVSAGVTVFNVVSTNASGCTAVTPVTVTGLSTPTLTPVSASLCVGLPLNLTGVLGTGNVLTGLTSTLLGGAALPTSVSAGVNVFNVVSTNASGCTAVTPVTVTGLDAPALTPVSASLCVGLPLNLTGVLGTGNTLTGLTSTLLGGATPPTSVSAGVNVFNVVSTNASGCTAVTPVTVTGADAPALTPVSASLCVDLPLNLTGVLGTGNVLTGLTSTLLGGASLPTSVSAGVTVFNVVSTNASGCTAVTPVTVTGLATPTLTPVSASLCVGLPLNLTSVLGTSNVLTGLTNTLLGGGTLPTSVSAGVTVFNVVSTNASGCTAVTPITITGLDAPALTPVSVSLCVGLPLNLTSVLGTGNGLTGLTSTLLGGTALPTSVSAGVTVFNVVSTNAIGCTAVTPITVTGLATPALTPVSVSLCVGLPLNLTGVLGTGNVLTGLTNTLLGGATLPTSVSAGVTVFNVVSTNASGCTAVTPVTVTSLATPTLTPVSVSLCVGLPLNLTGVLGAGNTLTGLTNTLLGGGTLPTSVSAGVTVFNVVSTNASGCTAVTPVTVTGLSTPTLTPVSASLCVGLPLSLTSVLDTGAGNTLTGLTNTLLGGAALPTSVSAGVTVFNVVSTNASGCTAVTPITITGLDAPALTPVSVSLCVGLPLNLTSVLGTGNGLTGLTSTLLGGTALPTSVSAGVTVFNVVSTNAIGCTAVTPITVTGLDAPALTPVSVSLCIGLPLNLTGVLGTGTGNTLTGLTNTLLGGATLPTSVSAGVNIFNVVSTNASGCTAVTPVTVTGLDTPALTPVSVSLCVGLPLNLTGVLGTGNLLTGLTSTLLGGTALPTSVSAGVNVFNVVSTNASGCTAVTPVTVTGLATPILTPVSVSLCVGLPLNLTGVLGTNNTLTGLTSTLLGGGTLPTSVSAGVTVFNVVSTNASGCTAVTPVTVTGLATPTLTPVSVSLCVGLPLNLTGVLGAGNTLTGLTNTLLGGGTLPTSVSAGVTVFNVVSTNASGCTAVTPVTVTGLATPVLTPVSASLCVGLPLNLTGVLGTGNVLTGLTSTLLGGATLPTSVSAGVTVFNVVSTNASGCTAVTPVTVTGLTTPTLTPVSANLCVGLPLNLTGVLGTGNVLTGLTSTLLGGAALPTSVSAGVNVFNVVSTNASGCTAVTSVTVTGLATPALAPISLSLCVGSTLDLTSLSGLAGLTGNTNVFRLGDVLGAGNSIGTPTSVSVGSGLNFFNLVSTNPSGCSAAAPITVIGIDLPDLTPISASLCVGTVLDLTNLLGDPAPGTINLFRNNLTGITITNPTAVTVGLGVNLFSVVSTNAQGCSAVAPISVTGVATPTLTPVSVSLCAAVGSVINLNTVLANATGLPDLSNVFQIGTGIGGVLITDPTAVSLTAGANVFTTVSTNASGCANTTQLSIVLNPLPILSPTSVSLCISPGTTVDLGTLLTGPGGITGLNTVFRLGDATGGIVTTPSTVSLNTGVNLFTAISTNPVGCTVATPITVTAVAAPVLSPIALSLCAGTSLNLAGLVTPGGSLSALAGLGNVFRIGSSVLTAPVLVNAGINVFNVVSTNASGCTAVTPITVTGLATPTLTPVSVSLCVGLPLNLTGVLGTGTGNALAGLTNTLLGGATLPTSVSAGVTVFNVVSTNVNGCTAVTPVTVTGLDAPTLTPVSVSLCVGLPLNLTGVLGTGNVLTGLTSTLLGGGTLPTSVSAGVAVFNVVSTNASGCTAVTPVTVTGLATPTLTPVSVSLCVGLPLNLTGVLGTSNVLTGLTSTLLGGASLPTSVGAGVNVFNVVSTNASGCTAVTPITVTGLTTPTLTPVSVSLCVGLPLNLTGVLGTSNVLTGLTNTLLGGTALPTSVSAGVNVFNVVSTNASGCTAVTPVTVTGLDAPALTPVSVSLCVGLPLNLTSVLGTGTGNVLTGLTSTLLGGASLPTSVSAGVNVFNVVSTNASGCTAVTPVTVTGLATPTLTPVSVSLCVGLPLNLTGVLGTGNVLTGLTSTLLGGATLPTSVSVGVNVFNVVSTNASGCTAVTPITVTGLTSPVLTPVSVSLCVGLPLSLTSVLDTGAGNTLTGLTTGLLTGGVVTALPTNLTVGAGLNVFNVISTNASGCTAVTPVTVTGLDAPALTPVSVSLCIGLPLNLTGVLGTGNVLTGLTSTLLGGAALPTSVSAGLNVFNVVSTNASGCTAVTPVTVTGLATPTLTPVSVSLCVGLPLNLTSVLGTGNVLTGLTSTLLGGGTLPTSVSAGVNVFNVVSTNASGCTAVTPVTVTGLVTPALIPVSVSLCVGLPLNLTGVLGTNNTLTGLTNTLLGGTALPTSVSAGLNVFNVVSTNASGCTAVTPVTVTGLDAPILTPVSVSLCVGLPLNLTSVLGTGTGNVLTGLTSTLLGGATLPTSVSAGVNTFNVVSTNASGCTAVTSVTVTGLVTPALIPVSVSLCVGLPLNLTGVLGTNNTLTGLTNTLLGGGTLPTSVSAEVTVFNVVSTNASGCTAVTPVTVTGLATPALIPVSVSLCVGLPLNLTGVLGTNNTLTGLISTLLGGAALPTSLTVGAGVNVFNVVSTNATGCTAVTPVTVTGLDAPTLTPVSVSLCVGLPLNLTSVLGTGNTLTGLTSTLLGGTALPTSVSAGVNVFNVVSTNASGCTAVTPITVTGLAAPTLTPVSVSLCVGLPLNLTGVLGTGNVLTGLTSTLLGGGTLPTSVSAGVNVFNVVSTNASGCTAVTPITVTGLTSPVLTPVSVSLCVGLPLSLTSVLDTGAGNTLTGLTSTLLGGATLPTNLTVGAGVNVFNVVSTNASGCTAVTPVTVTGLDAPALTPVSVSLCVGLPLNLTGVLGTGNVLTGLTSTLLGGGTLPTSVSAGVNVFNVVSTNASGCTAVTPITVTGLAAPTLTPVSVSLCVGLPLNLTGVLGTGNVLTGLTSTLLGGATLPTSVSVGVNVFNVVSTNASGCTAVTPITVTGLTSPVLTPVSVSLCVGLPLSLTSVLDTGAGNTLTGLTTGLLTGGVVTALPTNLTVGAGLNVFNVISTNASGCTAVTPVTVTGLDAPALTPVSVSLCIGLPLNLTGVLGTGNVLTGLTSTLLGGAALPTSVSAGLNVFNVVSTNASGCTAVTPVTVTGLATPTLTPVSVSLCVGLPLNLTSVLGTGNVLTGLTSTLLGGATLPTSVSAGVNVFNVVSTNASGCTAVTPVTVTGLDAPALTPVSVSLCVGLPLNLTGVLGTNNTLTGLTSTLLGGATLPTSVSAGVTVFNVVSTNASGCTAVTPVTVTGLDAPTLTPVSASLCVGLPLNLTGILGTGNVLTGLTNTLLGGTALPTSLTVGAGVTVFNVVSTNTSGCTAVTPITVTGLVAPALTPVSVSLCVGLPLNLTGVLGTNNTLTGLTNTLLGGTALPTSVSAGVTVFNVVSTNASGCTAVTPVTVTGLDAPILTPVSVSLCVGLPLNLTGVLGTGNVLTGLTNTLLGGVALPTSLTVGAGVNIFNVVSTNASGCTAVTPITVTGLDAPVLTPASVSLCVGLPLNLTGVLGTGNVLTGLTSTLLGGTALPTSVSAGVNVFNVVSTNASGCTAVTSITVTGLNAPVLSPIALSLCVGISLDLTSLTSLVGLDNVFRTGDVLGSGSVLGVPTSVSIGLGVNLFNVVSTNLGGCAVATPISVTGVAAPDLSPISLSLCVGATVNLTNLMGLTGLANVFFTGDVLGTGTVINTPTSVSVGAGLNLFNVVSTNPAGCSAATTISVVGVDLPELTPISASLCVGTVLDLTDLVSNVPASFTTVFLNGAGVAVTNPAAVTIGAGVNLFTVVSTNALGCSAVTSISVTGVATPTLTPVSVSLCAAVGTTVNLNTVLANATGLSGLNNVFRLGTGTSGAIIGDPTAVSLAAGVNVFTAVSTNATSCSNTTQLSIELEPVPTLSPVSVSLCAPIGATVDLNALLSGTNNLSGLTTVFRVGGATGGIVTTPSTVSLSAGVNLFSAIGTNGSDCADTTQISVNLLVQPVVSIDPALQSQTICTGTQPASIVATVLSGTVVSSQFFGPLTTTTGSLGVAISGATGLTFTPTAGQLPTPGQTSFFALVTTGAPGCSDTTFVSITVNPQPVATVASVSICLGESANLGAQLTVQPGTTSAFFATVPDAQAGINPLVNLTVSPTVSTTFFTRVTLPLTGCFRIDSIRVTVNAKPSAGTDQTLVCNGDGSTPTSTTLVVVAADAGTWSQLTGEPATIASPNSATTSVSSLTAGSYSFVFTTVTGCSDTVNVTVPVCQQLGSIGDFVWNDLNNNGRQDAGEPGVDGIRLTLFVETTPGQFTSLSSVVTQTVNGQAGFYTFTGLTTGNYRVQLDKTTLPTSFSISPDANRTGVPDDLDSDFDPASGFSTVVAINTALPNGTLGRNNPTVDAAITSQCPPVKCVPFVIQRTRTALRTGR